VGKIQNPNQLRHLLTDHRLELTRWSTALPMKSHAIIRKRLKRAISQANKKTLALYVNALLNTVEFDIMLAVALATIPGFNAETRSLRNPKLLSAPVRLLDYVGLYPHCVRSEEEVVEVSDEHRHALDMLNLKRDYGKSSLSQVEEMKVLGNLSVSKGLISGTDPELMNNPHWNMLLNCYREMHSTLEVIKVNWSASEMMDHLPRLLETIRVGKRAKAIRGMDKTTKYSSSLHMKGDFGGSYTRPGGPLELVWGLTLCSGVGIWLNNPTNEDEILRLLNRIRKHKKEVDAIEGTELLFIVLETYSWSTLRPRMSGCLKRVADLCRSMGIAVVADETFTGLGIMGDGYYFSFQHPEYGYTPDFVVTGKQGVLASLSINKHEKNPFTRNYCKLELSMVSQNSTTVFADVYALERTSSVITSILLNTNYLTTGREITQKLPNLLKTHGLSTPTGGGGFVWKFELTALSPALERNTDGFGRMRLPLDATMDTITSIVKLLAIQNIAR
jgi:hypothetical protein